MKFKVAVLVMLVIGGVFVLSIPLGVAPPPDQDSDGIPDADDHCPTQPGPPENCGCPVTGNVDIVFVFDTSGSMYAMKEHPYAVSWAT